MILDDDERDEAAHDAADDCENTRFGDNYSGIRLARSCRPLRRHLPLHHRLLPRLQYYYSIIDSL